MGSGSFDPGTIHLRPTDFPGGSQRVQDSPHALARQRRFVGVFLELLEDVRLRVVDVPARVVLENHVDESRCERVTAALLDFAGPEVFKFGFEFHQVLILNLRW